MMILFKAIKYTRRNRPFSPLYDTLFLLSLGNFLQSQAIRKEIQKKTSRDREETEGYFFKAILVKILLL